MKWLKWAEDHLIFIDAKPIPKYKCAELSPSAPRKCGDYDSHCVGLSKNRFLSSNFAKQNILIEQILWQLNANIEEQMMFCE